MLRALGEEMPDEMDELGSVQPSADADAGADRRGRLEGHGSDGGDGGGGSVSTRPDRPCCDNCTNAGAVRSVDVSVLAACAVRAVSRLQALSFGQLEKLLRGSREKRALPSSPPLATWRSLPAPRPRVTPCSAQLPVPRVRYARRRPPPPRRVRQCTLLFARRAAAPPPNAHHCTDAPRGLPPLEPRRLLLTPLPGGGCRHAVGSRARRAFPEGGAADAGRRLALDAQWEERWRDAASRWRKWRGATSRP